MSISRSDQDAFAVESHRRPAAAQREAHELGLVTLCIGGGQGTALLLDNAQA